MVNEEMEVLLPDGTKLIAKTECNAHMPGVILYHINGADDLDEIAFVEYNPDNPFGQKLQVGAYRNDDDECKYFDKFSYCIKPSYVEMLELCKNHHKYSYFEYGGFIYIQRSSDNMIVYRDFKYNDKPSHVGHSIVVSAHIENNVIKNIAFKCMDCNETIYSAYRPKTVRELFKQAKPKMDEIVRFTYKSELMRTTCLGYEKAHFFSESNYSRFWTDVNVNCKCIGYMEQIMELYKRFETDNFYNRVLCAMANNSDEGFIDIGNNEIATKYITDDNTFYIRIVPESDTSFVAWVYMYDNEELYKKTEPYSEKVDARDYSYILKNITSMDEYRNPRITYLDDVEDECWELFKKYAKFVGAEIGEGTDSGIAKEISIKFMAMVEKTFGIPFPKSKEG